MATFTKNELMERAFIRVAQVLHSFWEEQKDNIPRSAAVHSRLFDTLVYNEYITINKKSKERNYPEHVVPCAYIRDLAFNMFWENESVEEVAKMVGRLLRIAYITKEQAQIVDAQHKSTMPEGWDPKNGSILIRLENVGISVEECVNVT